MNQAPPVHWWVTLDNNPYTDPPPLLPKIDYMDHQQGWPEMAATKYLPVMSATSNKKPSNITAPCLAHCNRRWTYVFTTALQQNCRG